jgi:hypothetical protein
MNIFVGNCSCRSYPRRGHRAIVLLAFFDTIDLGENKLAVFDRDLDVFVQIVNFCNPFTKTVALASKKVSIPLAPYSQIGKLSEKINRLVDYYIRLYEQ